MLTPVENLIRQQLASSPTGWLSFAEVMRLALYHPEHGYYSGRPRRIGRSGDFYTAVSVGPLYGALLAQVALEVWEVLARPDGFTIVEQAAHDGQLMADVFAALQESPLAGIAKYCLVEPQAAYQKAQEERLRPLIGERLSWVHNVAELPAAPGFLVCNELLDAFPVHRLSWNGQHWMEEGVVIGAHSELCFAGRPIVGEALAKEASKLPVDLAAGYVTEVHPAATEWMEQLGSTGFSGSVLIADYGYESAEYYAPERAEGTLRRYVQHSVDGKVLEDLGNCDLTAHVNFSRVIEAAEQAGFRVTRFMEQGRFLTHAAAPWLRSLEGKPPIKATMALLRQFQALTHPGHMGAAFRMLLLNR